jgi:hypothetical protein
MTEGGAAVQQARSMQVLAQPNGQLRNPCSNGADRNSGSETPVPMDLLLRYGNAAFSEDSKREAGRLKAPAQMGQVSPLA